MSKPAGFEFDSFDFDAVWAALSRSTQLRSYMESLAKAVETNATSKARAEAYDKGYYAEEFSSGVENANEIRRTFLKDYQSRRNRRRRGQEGKSRLIDTPTITGPDGKPTRIKGDPDGSEYKGSIGYVINEDFKAVWIEYGSIIEGPRFILSRASEEIAGQRGAEFERLYDKTHEQDTAEKVRKVNEARAKNSGRG